MLYMETVSSWSLVMAQHPPIALSLVMVEMVLTTGWYFLFHALTTKSGLTTIIIITFNSLRVHTT